MSTPCITKAEHEQAIVTAAQRTYDTSGAAVKWADLLPMEQEMQRQEAAYLIKQYQKAVKKVLKAQ